MTVVRKSDRGQKKSDRGQNKSDRGQFWVTMVNQNGHGQF